jgi:hypothetical protein
VRLLNAKIELIWNTTNCFEIPSIPIFLEKPGFSLMYDSKFQPLTFAHSNHSYFTLSSRSCVGSSSISQIVLHSNPAQLGDVRFSPYGAWKLRVQPSGNDTNYPYDLEHLVGFRFTFELTGKDVLERPYTNIIEGAPVRGLKVGVEGPQAFQFSVAQAQVVLSLFPFLFFFFLPFF